MREIRGKIEQIPIWDSRKISLCDLLKPLQSYVFGPRFLYEGYPPGRIFGDCEQECTRLSTLQQGKPFPNLIECLTEIGLQFQIFASRYSIVIRPKG